METYDHRAAGTLAASIGQPNGVAPLDSNGIVPATNLPGADLVANPVYLNNISYDKIIWVEELGKFVAINSNTTNQNISTSPDGITWTLQTTTATGQLQDLVWADTLGLLVVVHQLAGTTNVITSPDGVTWTDRTTPDYNWTDIAWSNTLGLLVILATTGEVATSPDGITWTIKGDTGAIVRDIVWAEGLGKFVTVAQAGDVYTSADGETWSLASNLGSYTRNYLAWSETLGMLVTAGTSFILTSTDAVNWTIRKAEDNHENTDINDVLWVDDLGAFIASSDSFDLYISYDGFYWAKLEGKGLQDFYIAPSTVLSTVAWSPTLKRLVVGGSKYILPTFDLKLEKLNASENLSVAHTDFDNKIPPSAIPNYEPLHKSVAASASASWEDVCWSPELNLFVAVSSSTGNHVMTSPDGETWTARTVPDDLVWKGVCWSPELALFVAVAASGTGNRVMTSTNGTTWTARTCPDEAWNDVCWSPELELFVAVGGAAVTYSAMTSPDGINWTGRVGYVGETWDKISWSPELGLFAAITTAIGATEYIVTSPDGVTWTPRAVYSGVEFGCICWSPALHMFVALPASASNKRGYSYDGINWFCRTESITTTNGFYAVIWVPELKVFIGLQTVGTKGAASYYSYNGIDWYASSHISSFNSRGLAWSPELRKLVAVGYESYAQYIEFGIPGLKKREAQVAPGANPTLKTDIYDTFNLTGLAAAITGLVIVGEPNEGDKLTISFTDDGTGRALAFGTNFEASTVALPTTTVAGEKLTCHFLYNSATEKFRLMWKA